MTPIQADSLPTALSGRDVAGQGQTGTGKTAAFLIAAFERLLRTPTETATQPRCIILAPTRELAIQIHKEATLLGRHTGVVMALAYGGVDYKKQRETIEQGIDMLIGTPGRIIDYFKQGVYNLNSIEVLILDEADRMFDLGFIKDIRFLLRRMPGREERLNLLFSATLSHRVLELAYEHMNEPKKIEVKTDTITADRIKQRVYYPANPEKIPLLISLLRETETERAMVFCNTKAVVNKVSDYLNANGFNATVMSGDVRQTKRESLLKQFKNGEIDILVVTDLAARGLHLPDVSHVFNFDLPHDPEDYVHRIGRTARLGNEGDAISFACENYAQSLPLIEDFIDQRIENLPIDESMLPELVHPKRRSRPKPTGRGRHSSHGRSHSSNPRPASSSSGSQAGESGSDGAAPKRKRRRRKPAASQPASQNSDS